MQSEIHRLHNIKIPRWIGDQNGTPTALVAFADALMEAYGAVIYQQTGSKLVLVAAKSRVAPIKHPLTIPRLELAAASTLAELMNKVLIALKLTTEKIEVRAYSDSKITLAWIKNREDRWKSYVQARVKKIKAILPAKHWHHVGTKSNSADHLSRGLTPSELIKYVLWWKGPESLPIINTHDSFDTILEAKNVNTKVKCLVVVDKSFITAQLIPKVKTMLENEETKLFCDNISSWTRLVRVTAWCLRALSKVKPKN